MKQFDILLRALLPLSVIVLLAPRLWGQAGDTVVVQTFSFDDPSPQGWSAPYRGTFTFPPASETFEKVLMYYTLKCDPATAHDSYPCGEWDYLSYTYVVDSAGVMDSTYKSNPTWRFITGGDADSLPLRYSPTWTYYQEWQPYLLYTDTLSWQEASLGTDTQTLDAPFSTSAPTGRAQFLWRASELQTAGLSAGPISGLRLDLSGLGSSVQKLRIRLKHSTLDSLTSSSYESGGFTEVYYLNTTFASTGWQSFAFTQPFVWDGSSHLVVEFSYENGTAGQPSPVRASAATYSAGVYTAGNDHYLDFDGSNDLVNLGSGPQLTGTAPRTIELWAYAGAFNNAGLFQAGPTGATGQDFSLRTMSTNNLWRVQLWGTPDFDVSLPGSLGSWHHYALTYEAGQARLYYDGILMHTESVSINTGASDFWLGRWSGDRLLGHIDEVRVWDKALDGGVIAAWKDRSITAAHPDYAHLRAYYPLDEGQGLTATDLSGNGFDGTLLGPPDWRRLPDTALRRDWTTTALRPNVVFEQGTFVSSLDSLLSVDSVQQAPLQVVVFGNPSSPHIIPDDHPQHPSLPTDTLLVWTADTYSYVYDLNSGAVLDSVFIAADTTLYRGLHEYYSNIVEYEIARYITPYGINLDLGPDGTRWIFDVTDYAPLFHDQVYLRAGNNQELLDLKFVMIKGTPPRPVQKIENLWSGSFSYASLWNDTQARPITKTLDPQGDAFRIKMRISGHGFGGSSNCAEFCAREHSLSLNSLPVFSWEVWNECANNFVYPQGGTWIYDRAGWCPGAEVTTFDFDLDNYVIPGQTVAIDYGIQNPAPYSPEGNYVLRGQLVTYGPPAHTVEVGIEEIISPTLEDKYRRRNPVCDHPRIRIRNNGTERLTKVYITYGVLGGWAPCYYIWEGDLGFLESEEIDLPRFNWLGMDEVAPVFYVQLDQPNGKPDEQPHNNYLQVEFAPVARYINKTILEIRTNGAARENSFTITDTDGNVVMSRDNMQNHTVYQDTIDLPKGCYTLHIRDDNVFGQDGQDGISWWANNDGAGHVYLLNPDGTFLKRFGADFGMDIYEQFTVYYDQGNTYFPELECDPFPDTTTAIGDRLERPARLYLYPNPSPGAFTVELDWDQPQPLDISVYDALGHEVYQQNHGIPGRGTLPLQLLLPDGIYLVRAKTPTATYQQKLLIQR